MGAPTWLPRLTARSRVRRAAGLPCNAFAAPLHLFLPMTTQVTIGSRFCGPPGSGNGGYCAGLAAAGTQGAVEVTLRKPPPLDRPLRLERGDPTLLRDGAGVVAEVRSTRLAFEVPPPPSLDAAEAMSRRFVGFARHAFPTCFVCGPARSRGDGLRIFPGSADGGGPVSAPWTPDRSLGGADGHVRPEFLWAALDCPGYFAIASPGETALLGRMAAEVDPQVAPGERCVVVAWAVSRMGRKLHAGTALYDGSGTLRGRSLQTWLLV
jgi:hypothetical protein